MKIYVGNLSYGVTENDLGNVFSQYGEIASVKIITEKGTGRSKGFGFVEMNDDGQANTAIESLNGFELGGRKLRVNEARPQEENHGGRSGGGSRGGFRGGRSSNGGGSRGGYNRY